MSKLELKLLGTPQISIDGTLVNDFVMRKATALLIYLAVNQRTYTRAAVAGLFWPDVADDYAKNSLRHVLPNLRKLVGSYLQIDRQILAFDKYSTYWLDVEIFTTMLSPFALAAPPLTVDFERLAQALALYRGDFLEGFYLHDAPAFEEWVLFQREQLRLLATRGLTRLADLYIAQAAHATGLATTQPPSVAGKLIGWEVHSGGATCARNTSRACAQRSLRPMVRRSSAAAPMKLSSFGT